MFRNCQAAIVEQSNYGQAMISLWAKGLREMKYAEAVHLSQIFTGTKPADWLERKFPRIERAVAKWIKRNRRDWVLAKRRQPFLRA